MKNISRYYWGVGSAVAAVILGKLIQLPHGLPESTFVYGFGPISAFAGYEAGTWLGRTKRRRALLGAFIALIIVPLMFISYQWLLDAAWPSLFTSAMLYFTYSGSAFALFSAMGVLKVKVFDEGEI